MGAYQLFGLDDPAHPGLDRIGRPVHGVHGIALDQHGTTGREVGCQAGLQLRLRSLPLC